MPMGPAAAEYHHMQVKVKPEDSTVAFGKRVMDGDLMSQQSDGLAGKYHVQITLDAVNVVITVSSVCDLHFAQCDIGSSPFPPPR